MIIKTTRTTKKLELKVGQDVKAYKPINNSMANEINGKIMSIDDGIVTMICKNHDGSPMEHKVRSIDVISIH